MNYAEKELREVMAYLDEARAQQDAVEALMRAFRLGQPIEITLRSTTATVTTLRFGHLSGTMLDRINEECCKRVEKLEQQEIYWCREVGLAAEDDKAREALAQSVKPE